MKILYCLCVFTTNAVPLQITVEDKTWFQWGNMGTMVTVGEKRQRATTEVLKQLNLFHLRAQKDQSLLLHLKFVSKGSMFSSQMQLNSNNTFSLISPNIKGGHGNSCKPQPS